MPSPIERRVHPTDLKINYHHLRVSSERYCECLRKHGIAEESVPNITGASEEEIIERMAQLSGPMLALAIHKHQMRRELHQAIAARTISKEKAEELRKQPGYRGEPPPEKPSRTPIKWARNHNPSSSKPKRYAAFA